MVDVRPSQRPLVAEQKQHPVHSSDSVQYLSDDEINRFLDDLDRNRDGIIEYSEVEEKLDHIHDELVLKPTWASLFKRHGAENTHDHNTPDDCVRHAFLRSMMGSEADRIPRDEFASIVRRWKIPSLVQSTEEEDEDRRYFKRRPAWRKLQAYWSVHGPKVVFICVFVAMELAFGIWQLVKYQTVSKYRAAFGWGVVMSKTCAGTLYPTFFFLILSMSRYLSTFLRRWYGVSRFFSFGLSQEFHIIVSCLGLLEATLHGLGHLAAGTFRHGSDPRYQSQVAVVLGADAVPRTYVDYVRSLPGWTGIVGLGLFYILSVLSTPQVRRWSYEVFQLGHLLMFPIIGLMMAHGTAALLQWPMFGYFLAFPTLLVLMERVVRVSLGFHRVEATVQVLDDATVEITATVPSSRIWKYRAGQYIFLQVPAISLLQWHPFTVSFNRGNTMVVHIKTDGNWTGRLRKLALQSSAIQVGINGPFGAPAQHFYDFQQSIIIGAGIGVTPFAGILADMQHNDDLDHGGPDHRQHGWPDIIDNATPAKKEEVTGGGGILPAPSQDHGPDQVVGVGRAQEKRQASESDEYRRVDFHWMVRDRNYLLWFADLLNDVSISQEWHHTHEEHPHLDVRINTHVTAKRKSISTHVFSWLLEMHRTDRHPESILTGLLNPTHFGRPDMDKVLDEHYAEMLELQATRRQKGHGGASAGKNRKGGEAISVGVFYCGAPVVGEILADKCRQLTTRGRYDGSKIEYHFLIEVF